MDSYFACFLSYADTLFAVSGRGLSDDFFEMVDEMVGVFVTHLITDFVNFQAGFRQKRAGLVDTRQMQILDRRH